MDRTEGARAQMVRRTIEARGVRDEAVLQAMRRVPRERFMPSSGQSMAYYDGPVPIGHGQTISQPYIVGLMISLLEPRPGQRVLEVGSGLGYQAAVLSCIYEEVHSLEIVDPLAAEAATRLQEQGYTNVTVHLADGHRGLPEQAPFDAIILAAAPTAVPPALLEQLAPGGRMVLPVGPTWGVQELRVLERGSADFEERKVLAVRFVPMTGGP